MVCVELAEQAVTQPPVTAQAHARSFTPRGPKDAWRMRRGFPSCRPYAGASARLTLPSPLVSGCCARARSDVHAAESSCALSWPS
eukprot:3284581-Prymnesium_polylepis.1